MSVLPTEFSIKYLIAKHSFFTYYHFIALLFLYIFACVDMYTRTCCYIYILYIYIASHSDGALSVIYVSSFDFGVVLPSRAGNGLIALTAPHLAAFSLALFFCPYLRPLSFSDHHPLTSPPYSFLFYSRVPAPFSLSLFTSHS